MLLQEVLDDTACVLCGSVRLQQLRGYERAHLSRCQACGMVFSARKPSPVELEKHYSEYGFGWLDSPITRARYRELLDNFEPYRRNNRIFDSGCGAGFFLDEARARGWEAFGSELSERALRLCRERRLQVYQAPLELDQIPSGTFDVVTSFEVVEHLPDPRSEAQLLSRLAREGGLLYCTTPNFNALSRRVLRDRWTVIEYPEHLSYFTKQTLLAMLEPAGFAAISVDTTGISLSRLHTGLGIARPAAAAASDTDDRIRSAAERSPALGRLKAVANGALNMFGTGDTLKATLRRTG